MIKFKLTSVNFFRRADINSQEKGHANKVRILSKKKSQELKSQNTFIQSLST